MAVIPLVHERKMVDVGKLISLGNLLVRKVTWLVLITTFSTLMLSRTFGADCMTRIAYIYSRLPRTHSLHFDFQRQHINTHTHTLSLSLSLFLSLSLLHFDFQQSTLRKCIHSATFFFPVLLFRLEFFQSRTQPQKFPKETNDQHGRRHVPPRTRCNIYIYRYFT